MKARFRGLLYTSAIVVVGLSLLSWAPRAGRFYGERNARILEIVSTYNAEKLALASYVLYLRSGLDGQIYSIAYTGGDPYSMLSLPPPSSWAGWMEAKLEEDGWNASVQATGHLSELLFSTGGIEEQNRCARCFMPSKGAPRITGNLYISISGIYTLKSSSTRVDFVHPVRIYALYKVGKAVDTAVNMTIQHSWRGENPCAVASSVEQFLLEKLEQTAGAKAAQYGMIHLRVQYTITVTVKRRLAYSHHTDDGTEYTYKYTVRVSISYSTQVTDMKPDAKVFAAGSVKRVTWRKSDSKSRVTARWYKTTTDHLPPVTRTCVRTGTYTG